MGGIDIASNIPFVIILLLSLSIHEYAHAWTAAKLGDDTAEKMGRLTINPIVHIDLFGTILLPLMGVPFGWAKPVPVNPMRFHRHVSMRAGMMWTAAAGPLSNVLLAAGMVLSLGVMYRLESIVPGTRAADLMVTAAVLNAFLAVFNSLPIVPLDGSRVLEGLIPDSMRGAWASYARMGPLVLLSVIFLPRYMGWPFINDFARWLTVLFRDAALSAGGLA